MDVAVTARRPNPLGRRIRSLTVSKVNRLERLASRIDRAEVVFASEPNPRIADHEVCEVHLRGAGRSAFVAKASGPDMLTALERAIHKLERQLRRAKGRTITRHRAPRGMLVG